MNKHNLLIKKIKQIFLSINNSIESNFNKIKFFKKNEFIRNNRVFFGISAVAILTLSYFLVPTMYNKNIIQEEIKNQIFKKYKIEVIFNEKIRYALLPKPHFVSKNSLILRDKKEIGVVKNLKVFIGIDNFFTFNKIKIKDLFFIKTDFNIKKKDLIFFEELLKTEPNENKIVFKKSNLFFNGLNEELLFLNKILNGKFFYDSFNLENVLISENEIFNIPYKIIVKNDKFNKELLIKFNSKKIRLDIENNTSYEDKEKKGIIDFLFVNRDLLLDYQIKENSLFFFTDKKKLLNGYFDFKPFYLNADLNYEGVSTKNLFSNDSILIDLIKTEILNNINLNVNINLDVKDITNINELNNLKLKLSLEQGNITVSKSQILWKNDLQIILKEGFINHDDDKISLIGKLVIEAKNIDNFYKSFQIKKKYRKDINQIEMDFVYNLNNSKFKFDNVKIDGATNKDLSNFINKYNSRGKVFFNKIIFKNFINDFFISYAG